MNLIEKGTIEGCTHPNAKAVDSESGYPSDTSIIRHRCFDCGAAWTEELTIAQQAALQNADRDGRRNALFAKRPVCRICDKPIKSVYRAILFTSATGGDSLVHGGGVGRCFLKALHESMEKYVATPVREVA